MYQLLAYFFFNIVGFLFFYIVWLKLEKPKPYDYTTIPGLKCGELALTKSSIVLPVGVPINKISCFRGNLDDIQCLNNVNAFLSWLHSSYGPLAAFYWSVRYTVSIANLELVNSLKKYKGLLKPANPLLYASTLFEIPPAWQMSGNHADKIDNCDERTANEQADLFVNYDPKKAAKTTSSWPRKWIHGPLVVVFRCEVEVDDHPIPANVPILISPSLLLDDSSDSQLDTVYNEFTWIFDACF